MKFSRTSPNTLGFAVILGIIKSLCPGSLIDGKAEIEVNRHQEDRVSRTRSEADALTRQKLTSLPVWLPDEYQDFLLIHNGGTLVDNAFRYPFSGMETISTIDFFYAVRSRSDRYPYDNLIDHGLLGHRNDLPRWSIPIARVDEESFILIFEDGPYQDGVWYFIWIHDDPDSDPYVETKGAIA